MASITIRNLDDGLKRRLRVRAAERGRSMDADAHHILGAALCEELAQERIHEAFRPIGGVELDLPAREPMREPPRFD